MAKEQGECHCKRQSPKVILYLSLQTIREKLYFVRSLLPGFLKEDKMDTNKLSKRIKLARVELDLTQIQLAQIINTQQKSISRYETGASVLSIETLLKITKVLKKPANYFLDE